MPSGVPICEFVSINKRNASNNIKHDKKKIENNLVRHGHIIHTYTIQ